jgi:sulfate/thiosulfate transport system permease protein
MSRRRASVLPGFGLTLGFTILYLSVVVLIPLATLFAKVAGRPPSWLLATLTTPRVLAACGLTFGASLLAATLDVALGLLVAWALVRYRFPGHRLADALVDLPFALPTAVAGIALTTLYAPTGILGARLASLGIAVAFTRLGIVVALTFIGLPFVVRTVQPVLQDLEPEVEEAAASLGATPAQTFRRVLLPAIAPALLTGFALALARAIGEYGSVVFISGNMPMRTEIATLLVMSKLEQYDYAGASAIALAMLAVSFLLLLLVHGAGWIGRRRATA